MGSIQLKRGRNGREMQSKEEVKAWNARFFVQVISINKISKYTEWERFSMMRWCRLEGFQPAFAAELIYTLRRL